MRDTFQGVTGLPPGLWQMDDPLGLFDMTELKPLPTAYAPPPPTATVLPDVGLGPDTHVGDPPGVRGSDLPVGDPVGEF